MLKRLYHIVDENKEFANRVKEKYSKVFNGLGTFPGKVTLRIDKDVQPFFLSAPRTVPIPLLDKLKSELTKLGNGCNRTCKFSDRVGQPRRMRTEGKQ